MNTTTVFPTALTDERAFAIARVVRPNSRASSPIENVGAAAGGRRGLARREATARAMGLHLTFT